LISQLAQKNLGFEKAGVGDWQFEFGYLSPQSMKFKG
jgi:hypothetical protein